MAKRTRSEVLENLRKMANELSRNYSSELNRQMWRLCLDWNSDHGDAEIFMCESEDGDGRDIFCIEDDYWYYGE